MTPLEVASGQAGEDVSVAASGTDRAWRIGMNFCGGGSSGLRPVLTRVSRRWTGRRQWPIMCGLWGGSAEGGAVLLVARGRFVALDKAAEGVRWSSPAGGGANDGPVVRPWLAERQRPFDATVETVGLKDGGRWWPPSIWLARAQSRMNPSALSREVYLFVSGSATIALPTDRRTRPTGIIPPGF